MTDYFSILWALKMQDDVNIWNSLKEDYRRFYEHTSYEEKLRKQFHVWTSPGFQAVAGYRFSQWLVQKRIPFLGLMIRRMVEVWTGISIPPETQIGPGLLIHHSGGIVINDKAVLGTGATLHHQVTIGNRHSGGPSPKIGDRVHIGAGAKVLGGIAIGDDVEIGANAVVVHDLPDGAVAVGVPARIVRIKKGVTVEANHES